MDPTMIALALQGAGIGLDLFGQKQGQDAIEKANAEQAKRDAYTNLMAAAAGGGPVANSAVQAVPPIDFGGALSSAGSLLGQYATDQTEAEQSAALAESLMSYRAALAENALTPKTGSTKGPNQPTFNQAYNILYDSKTQDPMTMALQALLAERGINVPTQEDAPVPDSVDAYLKTLYPALGATSTQGSVLAPSDPFGWLGGH